MTTQTIPRASTRDARPSGGLIGMLRHQARAELLKLLRAPDFVAGAVLLPVVLFVLFGARAIGTSLPNGMPLGPFVVAAFTAYGLLGVVLFAFGESLAHERGQGWLRLSRATPLPSGVFLAGKLAAGASIGLVFVGCMALTASLLGAGISMTTWLAIGALGLVGALALAPIGFLIGFLVRPSAAGAAALMLYLPLSFASGMWMPVSELPELVGVVSPYLPTHHFAALVQTAVSGADPWQHIAWLAGTFVVGAAAAVAAYRRMAGRQFA